MSEFDPGPDVARERLDRIAAVPTPIRVRGTEVLVGTASWTDPTLTARGVFYPDDARTAEGRLRHYASQFPMVEVDASYYALPSRENAARWVERTPAGFAFDVKAFALMTGHPTETARLPATIRAALPDDVRTRARVYAADLPPEVVDMVWLHFRDALEPLAAAHKLGAVFFQYPPWATPGRKSVAMLEDARRRLDGIPIAVEFRHARWLSPPLRDRTMALLRRLDLSYVVVDEPQGMASSVPPELAAPVPSLAVLRLHGQRADLWERRGIPVVEKYRYLYSPAELEAWVPRIAELAAQVERLHVVFNNCYANYGVCNARELSAMLVGA